MSETAQNQNQNQYYLGIEGEQQGPFSLNQVSQMLEKGQIDLNTSIWCSGMEDWAPVGSLENFSVGQEISADPSEPPEKTQTAEIFSQNETGQPPLENFELHSEPMETVFSSSFRFSKPNSNKNKIIVLAILLLCGGGAALFYALNAARVPKIAEIKPLTGANSPPARSVQLSRLQTAFHQNPTENIPAMLELIKKDPNDNVGLEALEVLLTYYRQQQQFVEAGKLLVAAKRPKEAISYFLKDSPNYGELEKAYEEAARVEKGEQKKEYLLNQVDTLINRMGNIEKASQKLRELDVQFPGAAQPYLYYLKSNEEKVADIFSRISFHYSESLNNYIQNELPNLQFEAKPLIQVVREKSGQYRITGSYKGNVNLRNDRLNNIYFVFWLWNNQWTVADTNLTKERESFTQEDRKKHLSEVFTLTELLQSLENQFKTLFPGKGLHEAVLPPKPTSSSIND
jgi:GYF domain 2